jgi:hypothetical protein
MAAVNLQEKWKRTLEFERQCPQVVGITSLDESARTIEANPRVAALMVVMYQTHRLATPEEVERCRRDQKQREADCAAIELARARTNNVKSSTAYLEAMKELVKEDK